MKCVLPGTNVKVFGRAIHCLSKIGEDLYIEPLDNGLALRTVNTSRSAYACFLFAPTFFMQFRANTAAQKNNAPDVDEEEDDPFRCRITMKSCLAVFKSLSSLEKTVDKCRISLDHKECRLIFQLHCKHGIVKTYNLTYQETETLQAVFSKDLCPNHIVAEAKPIVFAINGEVLEATFVLATLADAPSSQISVTQQSTQRNTSKYRSQQASKRNNRSRQARVQRLPNGQAQTEDRPSTSRVTASVGDTSAMDIEFPDDIMLAAGDAAMERLSQQEANSQPEDTRTKDHNNPAAGDVADDDNDPADDDNDPDRTQGDISPSPVIPIVPNMRRLPITSKPSLRISPEVTTADIHRDNEDVLETSTSKQNRTLLANFEDEEDDVRRKDVLETSVVQDLDVPSDNEDYDFIPGTPPSKKFKSMFFGASQSQSQAGEVTRTKPAATVLAEDTDEESD